VSAVLAVPRPSRLEQQLLTRLRPSTIDDGLVREVLARFELSARGRPRDLGGRRSRNVAVATDRGRVVIKRYRAAWEPATVAYGHSILLRLEALGVPAPRLVRAPDASTWVQLGDGLYAVFDVLEGRGYASSYLRRRDLLGLDRRAGAALARMHTALEGFEPRGRHHMAFVSLTGPRERDTTWYAQIVQGLADRADRTDPSVARLLTDGPEALLEIAEIEDELDRLPRTVIHGDYGLHNVVFHGGQAFPLDLELSRLDLRALDLVLFLSRLVQADPERPDLGAWAAFTDGYGSIAPLTPDEREAFGRVWRWQHLTSAIRHWLSSENGADPQARTAAAVGSLDRAGWLEGRPDVVARLPVRGGHDVAR
jgi:Ser/Thr protein kinase RdoA (MazF antagonist)